MNGKFLFICEKSVERLFLADVELFGFSPTPGDSRHAEVVHNPVEPCPEFRITPELIETLKRPEEGILNQLLRFLPAARQAESQRECFVLVAIHQQSIPAGIPCLNLLYDVPVGIAHNLILVLY